MEGISIRHKAIIDSWFNNGFVGYKAVKEHNKELSNESASKLFNDVINKEENQEYINKKKSRLAIRTDIKNENIVRELINYIYSDATEFIGLTKGEIKELPSDIKRCIQSFKIIKKSYIDRASREHTDETIEIKLIDKLKALDTLNKHIGFYELNNKQKSNNINLNKIDSLTLNNIFIAMKDNDKLNV